MSTVFKAAILAVGGILSKAVRKIGKKMTKKLHFRVETVGLYP